MLKRLILPTLFVCLSVLGIGTGRVIAQDTVSNTYKEQVVVERTTTTRETQTTVRAPKANYRCAIFVTNRAERVDDAKVLAMQDLLTGYATDNHFTIIAREDVLNAVSGLGNAGPNRGNASLAGANLDQLLSNQASATRLAQDLNADYVLMVTITTFGTDRQTFRDPAQGIDMLLVKNQMRTTYRLLDGTTGGSVTAGVATASLSDRTDARNFVQRQNVVDDLLDAAAQDMAKMLSDAAFKGRIAAPSMAGDDISFQVNCNVADLSVPEVIKTDQGAHILGPGRYRLDAQAVIVEIDGVGVGTSPGPFKVKPGLHKLHLRRELMTDWEGTVNIQNGTSLDIAMKFSPEGYARFKDLSAFLENLKRGQALNEADVNAINGYAKMLEQSHIHWDVTTYINNGHRGDPTIPAMPAPPNVQRP